MDSWLHGKQENYPEPEVAWRAEVEWIVRDGADLDAYEEDALGSYRVLAKERLKEPSLRLQGKLEKIAAQDTAILFQARDGSLERTTVGKVAKWRLEKLADGHTVLVVLNASDANGAPVSNNLYWWAKDEAKAFRKRQKKQGVKVRADDGGKLQYAETFRVMTLVDNPQES